MAKFGKVIQNRITTGKSIISSTEVNAETIGSAVDQLLDGKWNVPDGKMEKLIRVFASLLEESGEKLNAAELNYVSELADDVVPRSNRDRFESEGKILMSSVRTAIEGVFGDVGLQRYGLNAPIEQTPKGLARQMEMTISLLRTHPDKKVDILDNEIDTLKLASKLSVVHQNLSEQLGILRSEERQRQRAINGRDRAVEEWNQIYQGAAHVLTGFYMLAGRRRLASQLKPTSRRASGQAAAAPIEPDQPGEALPDRKDSENDS